MLLSSALDGRTAVPHTIPQVFWRSLISYIVLVPKPTSSAFTIALTEAGILPAAHVINALIVTSVISACNCSLYIESCLLLFMCRAGKAPGFIGCANKTGAPWVGLIFTNIFACIVLLGQSSRVGEVYSAMVTLSRGMSSLKHR
ncbi:uncharacterized protein N7477_006339 [Penicillium maclennaniae]|uniref:uncharacterized protein n=1 Tax=Penicillium maclennaniae TaxID=1343394 RepID=UPI00253F9904|nr:uncharacterized protein N7477_006339 [Penicillium maclennaniae]KAJ5667769.1 hypothetical protein N7477_006339 [Penicillium maclennaniae]